MKKIATLTQYQFDDFINAEEPKEVARKFLSLSENTEIGIGDTAVKIDNAKPLEVYKDTWKGEDYFYIVIKPMSEELAMCYSIYPN